MGGSEEELQKRVEALEAQLEAERAKGRSRVQLKVSQKGGVSLYGIRRFPITFYLEEWRKILDMGDEIRAFLSEHESELKQRS